MRKKKGKGSKPKDQRRKRIKKGVVPETPKVQPPKVHIEQIEWKTRNPSHTNPWERRYPNSRIRMEPRIEKPLQPMDRSIEEVVIGSLNLKPSAPIPYQKFRNEEKMKNSEVEFDLEKLEQHEKKLVLIIVRLDRIEERIDKTVKDLDLKLTEFDSRLQAFATLTAHMEKIIKTVRR